MKINELHIKNQLFELFKNKVDEWVNDIAGWEGLDWDEEERIFEKMSQHDLENYSSMEYADDIATKFNDNTDGTVLDLFSDAWGDFKLKPKNFEIIMDKYFPSDIDENITSSGEATSTPKIFKSKIKEMNIKKGRRFNPPKFEFPLSLLKPLRFSLNDEPKIYFKIATNSKNESVLMIDPLVKTALDSIERGRSSFDKEQKLSRLTQYLKERVPQNIRGLVKKYSTGAKILGTGFISLPLIMEKEGEQWYVMNPNKDDAINKDINVPLYELSINEKGLCKGNFINSIKYFNKHSNWPITLSPKGRLSKLMNMDVANIMGLYDGVDYNNKNTNELNNRFNILFNKHKTQIKKILSSSQQIDELKVKDPNQEKINNPDYKFFVIDSNHKIKSGWEYLEDAIDFKKESEDYMGPLKVYSKKYLMQQKQLNPDNNTSWKLNESHDEVDIPNDVEQAASRLATLLNNHFEFGKTGNTSDTVLHTIIKNRDNKKWFDVAMASGKGEDKNIPSILSNWKNKVLNQNIRKTTNESKLIQFIKQQLLKEASYNQFKKEVKFRSKNEMLHKGIKTVKSKLQEVDRIVEYMSRMKQELSENDEGTQYWEKTKQSINKIQEIVEIINNKIKTL